MLRVGRRGIVTFPNFGYWRTPSGSRRQHAGVQGLPYQWYDTPNIHLFTIVDFEEFCAAQGIRVLERNVLVEGRPVA